ncbi:hypothetical protein AAFC00_000931 [Neodothiora populina]|uniref:Xylanolytic transcriptional activator regulatory domain-containing protein n=1 Tax=Neodothiora populina TaxID=2781224 RepID=A0ABR3PM97_9PEZI
MPRRSTTRTIVPKTKSAETPRSTVFEDSSISKLSMTPDDPAANKKQQELRAGIAAFNSNTHAYQFYGPSSHFSFVQRLYQRIRRQNHQPLMLEVQQRVPDGLLQWGVDQQIFTHAGAEGHNRGNFTDGNMLPKELGEAFIASYFKIMHPQSPILIENEVIRMWQSFWTAPRPLNSSTTTAGKDRSVLYMVLAIGARLLDHSDGKTMDAWAEHFYNRTSGATDVFEDTSLVGTHLLLLKAIYAMQIGRPNWIYLYLGHAARCAMALGLHRSQVVSGSGVLLNRLRLTFWTIYYMERLVSMYLGRPSSLAEDQIDAPFPDDLPAGLDSCPTDYAYVRAMAIIGRVSVTVVTGNYSPKTARCVSELTRVNQLNSECIHALQDLKTNMPSFLHFFDENRPIGEEWQEVQRTNVGITYHITRILIFRPALIYVTFFDSLALAQASIGDRIDIKENMDLAVQSARSLINLTYTAFSVRCPSLRRDGNLVPFIVSACLTLLFEILDSEATPAHATEVFHMVDKGLQCLDKVDHIGSITGKNISLDVMRIAKDALLSTEAQSRLESNIVEDFAWLNNIEFEETSQDHAGTWMYNAMGMIPNADPNQTMFDVMGDGLCL